MKPTKPKNKAAVSMAALRWNDVTPAERTRHARTMLAARWAKPRKAPKKKTRKVPLTPS